MLVTTSFLFAQPSIAVLDALLDEGVDLSARVPVTEKIIEALVSSGQYTVLDRGNVQQVLQEKKFQLSGMVRDSEIKQAGEYLGAEFVCVAKVSKIGQTYFVAAKIIDVETGKIISQISREKRGEIDIVLGIAHDVGVELMGGEVESLPDVVTDEDEKRADTGDKDADDTTTEAKDGDPSTATRRHVTANGVLPFFLGNAANDLDSYLDYIISSYGGSAGNYSSKSGGFGLHFLQPVGSLFYASAGGALFQRSDQSAYFPDSTKYYLNFTFIDLRAGVGAVFPISSLLQIYGGGGVNLAHLQMADGDDGDIWGPDFFVNSTADTSIGFYIEAGIDVLLFGPLVAAAQIVFSSAEMHDNKIFDSDYSINDYDTFSFGYAGITVGAGITF